MSSSSLLFEMEAKASSSSPMNKISIIWILRWLVERDIVDRHAAPALDEDIEEDAVDHVIHAGLKVVGHVGPSDVTHADP